MILHFSNKFMSGSSVVKDNDGRDVFVVKGWKISPTKYRRVFDMQGNLKCIVRNKLLKIIKYKAFIYNNKRKKVITIRQKVVSIPAKYFVEGQVSLTVVSNGFLKGLTVFENDDVVGEIKTENYLTVIDNFCINIMNEKYTELMVALAVAMDNLFDKKKKIH